MKMPDGARIEVESGPDSHGRYRYTLIWPRKHAMVTCFKGRRIASTQHAQCFHAALPDGVK